MTDKPKPYAQAFGCPECSAWFIPVGDLWRDMEEKPTCPDCDTIMDRVDKNPITHPPKPLAVPREVDLGNVPSLHDMRDWADGYNLPFSTVQGISGFVRDAVMAALAAHTTPRPTREELWKVIDCYMDPSQMEVIADMRWKDQLLDGIEALLDGKGEADE